MTTEQGRVPVPAIGTTASHRPGWVTDEVVAQLYSYAAGSDPVPLANQGTYGLSASIWPKDSRSVQRIRAGSVNINDSRQLALMRKLRVR